MTDEVRRVQTRLYKCNYTVCVDDSNGTHALVFWEEWERLNRHQRLDERDMRKFQEKFIEADHERRDLRAENERLRSAEDIEAENKWLCGLLCDLASYDTDANECLECIGNAQDGHDEECPWRWIHDVVETEPMPLRMLTQDEAAMRFEISGDDFLIFKNEADQKIKVMFRRKDEKLGLVQVEQ